MPRLRHVTDDIFTIEDFFTRDECAEYVRLAESVGFTSAPITTSFGPRMRPDIRNNTRVMIDDVERAAQLWARIAQHVGRWDDDWIPVGLNERLRFYRYDVGQQFDWHYDGPFERPNGERSWLTFMIYLNDGFVGGETSFLDTVIEPRAGMALIFVHQIRHKGEPVSQGRKYVVRSDVMYRYAGK